MVKPRNPDPEFNSAKPMEMNPNADLDHAILAELIQSPEISQHFDHIDDINDLFESLDAQELRIIIDSNDPQVLLQIKAKVQNDLNETAKQLAMEE